MTGKYKTSDNQVYLITSTIQPRTKAVTLYAECIECLVNKPFDKYPIEESFIKQLISFKSWVKID